MSDNKAKAYVPYRPAPRDADGSNDLVSNRPAEPFRPNGWQDQPLDQTTAKETK